MIELNEDLVLDAAQDYTFKPFVIKNPRIRILRPKRHDGVLVEVVLRVVDSATGNLRNLGRIVSVPDWDSQPQDVRDRCVRAAVVALLEHEVGEALLVRGEAIFDPHKPGSPWYR